MQKPYENQGRVKETFSLSHCPIFDLHNKFSWQKGHLLGRRCLWWAPSLRRKAAELGRHWLSGLGYIPHSAKATNAGTKLLSDVREHGMKRAWGLHFPIKKQGGSDAEIANVLLHRWYFQAHRVWVLEQEGPTVLIAAQIVLRSWVWL